MQHLAARLGNAITLAVDEYEASSFYPPAEEWLDRGADPNEFKFPQFDADVRALMSGQSILHPETKETLQPAPFLILEEPFGRGRIPIRGLIDFVVYLDTLPEVAYIRKISRKNDFLPWEDDPELFMRHLRENMEWYLRVGRKFYLAIDERIRSDCDLFINGLLPSDQAAEEILKIVKAK